MTLNCKGHKMGTPCRACRHTATNRSGETLQGCARSCIDCSNDRSTRSEQERITRTGSAAVAIAEILVTAPRTRLGTCIECGKNPVYEGRGYHGREMICARCA